MFDLGLPRLTKLKAFERLETELHVERLPNRKRLEQREVHVLGARPDQEVSRGIAQGTGRRDRERGGIEVRLDQLITRSIRREIRIASRRGDSHAAELLCATWHCRI